MDNFQKLACVELIKIARSEEFKIRSLSRNDPRFKTICEDYGEALTAMRKFEAIGETEIVRAKDFRQISDDLRREALAYLSEANF